MKVWWRLVWLEYVPMAALIATWALVGFAEGVRDMALLLAAFVLVGAIRTLTWINVRLPLRRRIGAGQFVTAGTWLAMWLCEAASSLAGIAITALCAWFAVEAGYDVMAMPLLVLAAGLPARQIGPLLARASRVGRPLPYVLARSCGGAVMVAAAIMFSDDLRLLAAALAAREWIGMLVMLALPWPPVATSDADRAPPIAMAEIADATRAVSHGQLGYRVGKVLFSVLGPFGTAAVRTMRGLGVFGRLDAVQGRTITLLVALGAAGIAAVLFVFGKGSTVFVVAAAAAARIAAAATSAFVWSLAPVPAIQWERSNDIEDD